VSRTPGGGSATAVSQTPAVTKTADITRTPSASVTPGGGHVCPHPYAWWKAHPDLWPRWSLRLGGLMYTGDEVQWLMNAPATGDGSLVLVRQLITAKLNVLIGADGDFRSGIGLADWTLAMYHARLPLHVKPPGTMYGVMVAEAYWLYFNNNNGCFAH
jgi:hypothetical protein